MKNITFLLFLFISTLAIAQTAPTITCPMDITNPVLGGSCDAIVNFNLPIATDAEDGTLMVTQTLGLASGSVFPLGDTLQEFTAEDSEGNMVSCQFTITVEDTQNPIALCQNVTVLLDENGVGTLTAAQVDAGSFDTCGIASLEVSQTDFTCDDLFTSIEDALYITGVLDGPLIGGAPKVLELFVAEDIADLSIYGLGAANNGGGTDGIEYTFPADAAIAGSYIYVAQDAFDFFNFFGFFPDYQDSFINVNGNDAFELFLNGTVIDVFGDINVDGTGEPWEYQDGWAYRNNNTSPTTVFNSNDWSYSGVDALDNETTNGTAAIPFPLGTYTFEPTPAPPASITLTVTDTSGNISTCIAQVTIEDALAPEISFCPGPISVITDEDTCSASNVSLGIPTVTDNCSTNITITNDAPDVFELGDTTVTWTATDESGNETTCEQIITVNDGVIPNAVCQNITVLLDENGTVTVTPDQVDGGSTDNCEIASMTLSNDTFTCDDIGTNNVALTITDATGNINACVVTITVEDILAPVVVCQNITVSLDENGLAEITADQIDNGSEDNCGIDTIVLNQTNFNCDNVGENTVTLTVTDVNGNINECEATVTIIDDIAPVALCQDITVSVDETGQVTIEASQVDGGSEDNCEIASLELDITTFTCNDIGNDTLVTLTVTDTSGNTSSCTATVTVVDETPPVVECINLELELDENGMASILPSDAVMTVEDGCGVSTITVSQDTFTCDNVGDNDIVVTVTDIFGNETECMAIITITDSTPPEVICQNITVMLDENGIAEITAAEIDGGSTDNCEVATIEIDTTSFNCENVGENEVILSVTDGSGNVSECTAIVTVVDTVAPTAVCQNITIALDDDGNASIEATEVDGGSFDNCGIVSLDIDVDSFDCSNQGENTITLTVTDENGNTSECEAIVTVMTMSTPLAECQNVSVTLDENGEAILSPFDVFTGDGAPCNLTLSQELFTCDDLGAPVQVTLSSTNANGDVVSSCTATINVVDNIFPTIMCPEDPVIIAALAPYELPDFLADGTIVFEDNCPNNITSVQTPEIGTIVEEGETDVTIVITDAGGNEISCEFTIFVDPSLNADSYAAQLSTITLYPNPASSFIVLENPNNLALNNAQLIDISGRTVKQFDLTATSTERILDISEIASASYFLIVEGTEGSVTFQVLKR